MPTTDTPTLPKKETWADWARRVDPDYDESDETYATLDELLEDLNPMFAFRNAEVTPSTVRYWQGQGLIPYPIKRWHNGATRALYPSRLAFSMMLELRSMQLDRGYALNQLREHMRARLSERITTIHDPSRYNLEPAIIAVARQREQVIGRHVTRVDVTFFDEQGKQTYRYDIPAENGPALPDTSPSELASGPELG